MQPASPAPTIPPPPPYRSWARLAIAVVAIVVVVAVFFVAVYPMTLQPKITLTDSLYARSGCGFFGPYYFVFAWVFNLTNTGNANGFATVTFYVNGNAVGANQYYVPLGSTVNKAVSVNGPDHGGWPCPEGDSPSLAITAVAKA